jgi:hypothetical protein
VVLLLVDVVVEVLDVLVELLDTIEVVNVVEVVGTTSDSGSPQWASEQLTVWSASTSSATRHVFAGSAQWENGSTVMSQSVGIAQRGPRGSTQRHPAKNWNPLAWACTA